jgi:hypothetical protein
MEASKADGILTTTTESKMKYKEKIELVEKLRAVIESEGLAAGHTSEAIGLCPSSVGGYLSGDTLPTVSNCAKIKAFIALPALQRQSCKPRARQTSSSKIEELEARIEALELANRSFKLFG